MPSELRTLNVSIVFAAFASIADRHAVIGGSILIAFKYNLVENIVKLGYSQDTVQRQIQTAKDIDLLFDGPGATLIGIPRK